MKRLPAKESKDDPREAMNSALHLLKFRRRSESEMAKRLSLKGFTKARVDETVARLKELNLLDDASLAKDWVDARRRAGEGDLRIRQKLAQRGLARGQVQDALAEETSAAPDEETRAWDALQKRAPRLKNLDRKTAQSRLTGYLTRQGFTYDSVQTVLRRYFKQIDADFPEEP